MGTNWNTRNCIKQKKNYCEGGQILKQIAQRVSEYSLLGDIQNPTGHSPGQPSLSDPAQSKVVEQDNILRCLPTSAFLYIWKNYFQAIIIPSSMQYYCFVRKKPYMVSNPFSLDFFYSAFCHLSPYECYLMFFVISTLLIARQNMFHFSELLNFKWD